MLSTGCAALDVAALDEDRLPAGSAVPLTPAQPLSPAANTARTPATRVKPGRARRRIIRDSRSLGTRPPVWSGPIQHEGTPLAHPFRGGSAASEPGLLAAARHGASGRRPAGQARPAWPGSSPAAHPASSAAMVSVMLPRLAGSPGLGRCTAAGRSPGSLIGGVRRPWRFLPRDPTGRVARSGSRGAGLRGWESPARRGVSGSRRGPARRAGAEPCRGPGTGPSPQRGPGPLGIPDVLSRELIAGHWCLPGSSPLRPGVSSPARVSCRVPPRLPG